MIVWSAGHNMPGYLPDGEPATFRTRADAMAYMVGELEYVGSTDLEVAGEYAGKAEDLACGFHGDTGGGDWSWRAPDGEVYWVESVDLEDDEALGLLSD